MPFVTERTESEAVLYLLLERKANMIKTVWVVHHKKFTVLPVSGTFTDLRNEIALAENRDA